MRKYKIVVSEPWDYEGIDGPNIIIGVVEFLSHDAILFKADHILNFGNKSGDMLLLTPRFNELVIKNLPVCDLTVNGGLVLHKDLISEDIAALKEKSEFVLIGRISKI